MTKRYTHKDFKKALLKNEAVADVYEQMEDEFQLKKELIRARIAAGLTQERIAESMKTTRSSISRLESIHASGQPSPTIATLQKYAEAVGCKIVVKLVSQ